jgi:hypothetical protein
MIYYNVAKNEYPRHVGDIKLEYPEWEEGQPLPDGWAHLEQVVPEVQAEEGFVWDIGTPVSISDDTYRMVFFQREKTEEEKVKEVAREDIRKWAELSGLDFYELRDAVLRSIS